MPPAAAKSDPTPPTGTNRRQAALIGLEKTMAEKRIAEGHPNGAASPDKTASSAGVSTGATGRTINLIPLIDPRRDGVRGDWQVENGQLSTISGSLCPRVTIPYAPPEEYDIKIEWTQGKTRNAIFIVLTKNNSNFAFHIPTRAGEAAGIDGVARKRIEEVPCAVPIKAALAADVKHTAIAQVRQDGVTGIIDGQPIVHFKTDYKDLSLGGFRHMKNSSALGIGCDDPTVFTKIQIVEVKGAGKPLN